MDPEPLELRQVVFLPLIQRNIVRVALQFGVVRCMLPKSAPAQDPDLAVRCHVHELEQMQQEYGRTTGGQQSWIGKLDSLPPLVVDQMLCNCIMLPPSRTCLKACNRITGFAQVDDMIIHRLRHPLMLGWPKQQVRHNNIKLEARRKSNWPLGMFAKQAKWFFMHMCSPFVCLRAHRCKAYALQPWQHNACLIR